MAAQTWTSLRTMLLASLSKSQPPYAVVPDDFATLFPQATSYAEGRIYKDLVLLATREQNTSQVTVSGNRTIDLSAISPAIIVPEGFALLTPAASSLANGTRQEFDKASLDVIDLIWPVQSVTQDPSTATWTGRYWALLDDHTLVMAPTPDGVYTTVVTGLFQPTPISAGNPTTYLSTIYPELLEAACMVFLTGALLHNFGAQSDNPQRSLSWEGQYQTLMELAKEEEMRRRGLLSNVAQSRPTAPVGAAA